MALKTNDIRILRLHLGFVKYTIAATGGVQRKNGA